MRSAITVGLLCGACAVTQTGSPASEAERLYQRGVTQMEHGLYPEALTAFGEVRDRFPYAKQAALAALGIADTQLRSGKSLEAIDSYRSFTKHYPNHQEVPRALLQIGQAHYARLPEDWWFMPPVSEKDQGGTSLAIAAFREVVKRFPNHEHALTARERIAECRRRLADHELYVARFYFERGQYRAVVRRSEGVLLQYPDLGLDATALWLLAQAHRELSEPDKAQEVAARLVQEFPDSPETKAAQATLR